MKNVFTLMLIGSFVFFMSCKDDEEPEVDPLVGIWELDDASVTIENSSYFGGEGSSVVGESSYVIEFRADGTYERELEDVPYNTGPSDASEEGEWEKEGDQLDLFAEDDELEFLIYAFSVVEVDDRALILEQTESTEIWSDNKIEEWIADGTLVTNSNGTLSFSFPDVPSGQDTTTYLTHYSDSLDGFLIEADAITRLEFDRE